MRALPVADQHARAYVRADSEWPCQRRPACETPHRHDLNRKRQSALARLELVMKTGTQFFWLSLTVGLLAAAGSYALFSSL